MRIQRAEMITSQEAYTVSVDPNELVTDSGKPLPYATTIGLITRKSVKVWTPAAYKPRGYAAAAKRLLEAARLETFR